jgi:transposase
MYGGLAVAVTFTSLRSGISPYGFQSIIVRHRGAMTRGSKLETIVVSQGNHCTYRRTPGRRPDPNRKEEVTMTLLDQLGQPLPERYYLGVDVGYKAHVAAVISLETFVKRGDHWKRAPCLDFPSTQVGLEKLKQHLDSFSPDPHTFLGLCEPTGGFYGATLFQFLLDRGYPMWWIENATTRHMREKILGHLPKTDETDARVMARIAYLHQAVGEEFSLRPLKLANADNQELLQLCRDSWKLKSMMTRARNQFSQLMAVTFPELKTFFTKSVSTLAPVMLVNAYPTPAELAAAPAQEIADVLWKAGAYHHARRAEDLQALASNSSGLLPDPGRAWRIAWLTDYLLTNFEARLALDRRIRQQVKAREAYQWIKDIPYAGPATLAVILAVTGDINRFPNYRRYVAYTGYFAGLETSQTIDRTRMSKRGNRDLKRALFQIAGPLVWFDHGDNAYKALFERKVAQGRPWYKAMPYVCAALARHIYHCLKFKDPYDVEKAFAEPVSSPASEQVETDLGLDLDGQFEVMEAHLAPETD